MFRTIAWAIAAAGVIDPPLAAPSVAPGLSGAFADAIHARLKGSRSIERPPQ